MTLVRVRESYKRCLDNQTSIRKFFKTFYEGFFSRRQDAEELFHGLLRVGFRNIHCYIHHQTENFAAGMPTDLAFRFAGRQAIFRVLEKERGEGWWGDRGMADY
jgi:hypothetical protein